VTTAMWEQLLQLWPMVAGRLSTAVRKANGLEETPEVAVAEAGKNLSEIPN
jgi:hypothetical protein